jgi:glycosyltransferase involved in cell wall biosynthesis
MEKQRLVSIIVPVRNAPQDLFKCLEAIKNSSYARYEIIVVDDASTDETGKVAEENGAVVLRLLTQSGPGAARNQGAEKAKGEILLFIDSDVLVHKDTVARVASDFSKHPHIGALFGSYDDDPAEKNFFSQYKNLLHHFMHQISQREAVSFWAGCGAVRRDVFFSVGGFDDNRYSRPCIEDIEMGYRIRKKGHPIFLDKDLQVKHLKRWTFKSLLRADIFYRAVPWTNLMLENRELVSDLNLQKSQRLSAALVGLTLLGIPSSIYIPEFLYAIPFLLALVFLLNRSLFVFFLKRNGLRFTLSAFAMHLRYFFYSGATFSLCWLSHKFRA